jgi:hypothetical protein
MLKEKRKRIHGLGSLNDPAAQFRSKGVVLSGQNYFFVEIPVLQ